MSDVEFIFGGSFDPIHHGHLSILESLHASQASWKVRLIPCAVPALKQKTSASFEQRVEMIQLAVAGNQRVTIDCREAERVGKSYTYDTLVELKKEAKNRRLVLVIGSDNLASFDKWYSIEKFSNLCHLLVVNRPKSIIDQYLDKVKQVGFRLSDSLTELEQQLCGLCYRLKMQETKTSSTEIRKQLKRDLPAQCFDQSGSSIDTPEAVKAYIRKNLIYS